MNGCWFLVEEREEKTPLGAYAWTADYITVDLRDMGEDVKWIHLPQDGDK